jgi:hypothetical protein
MPTADAYFKKPESKYFRASDLKKEIVGTIASVDSAEFKDDDGGTATSPSFISRTCRKPLC